MKFIRKIKGAKNAEVNLVEIDRRLWVHKKEDAQSTQNEKAFYLEMKANGMASLEVLEYPDLAQDEIIIEYVQDSPTVANTVEDYEQWGITLRKLHNISYDRPTVLKDGELLDLDIFADYRTEIGKAKNRILERRYLNVQDTNHIVDYLSKGLGNLELSYCLVHGDMHSANVLKRGSDLVLFDKSSTKWSYTPLVDLAIVMLEIPNGYLVNTEREEYQNDSKLRNAFLKGYGSINMEEVRFFAQFQAARRINNSHEPLNPDIVKTILK